MTRPALSEQARIEQAIAAARAQLRDDASPVDAVAALEHAWRQGRKQGALVKPLLLDALRHSTWQVRCAGARLLGSVGLPVDADEAAVLFTAALVDDVPWSRSAARWTLRRLDLGDALSRPPAEDDSAIAHALAAALRGERVEGRRRALALVVDLKPAPHPDRVASGLADPEWRVRAAALAVLGRQKKLTEAVEAMVRGGLEDPLPGPREAAALAVGRLCDAGQWPGPALERALRALTEDEDAAVRQAALEAFSRWPVNEPKPFLEMGVRALEDEHSRVRGQGAVLLAHLGTGARPALGTLVSHLADSAESVRLTVTDTLKEMSQRDGEVHDALWRTLEQPRGPLRVAALRLLEDVHQQPHIPLAPGAVEQLLYQPSGQLWQAALWMLDKAPFTGAETAELLARGARHDAAPIRVRALQALHDHYQGALDARALSPTLEWSLRDPARRARWYSAKLTGALLEHAQRDHGELARLWPQLVRRLVDGEPQVFSDARELCVKHAPRWSAWLGELPKATVDLWPALERELRRPGHDLHRQSRFIERTHGHIAWYTGLIARRAAHRKLPDPFDVEPSPGMIHEPLESAQECIRLAGIFASLHPTGDIDHAARREGAWLVAQWLYAGQAAGRAQNE